MPTPPVPDEKLIHAVNAVNEYGSVNAAARKTGMSRRTLCRHYRAGLARGFHLSSGARGAVENAGLGGSEAKAGWIVRVDPDTGSRESTYWKAPEAVAEDFLDRLRAAFDDLEPAKPIAAPDRTIDDLLTLYPLFDVHLGMHSWGRETGHHDYDLKLAVSDIRETMANVMAWTPSSKQAILLLGGDYFHCDDNTAQTPRSRHNLNTDGRHFKVLETGIAIIAETAERLAMKHESVLIRVMRGNHDEHSHMALSLALQQRYRECGNITVEDAARDLFMHQWGRCLIAAHHGDKAKPQQLAMTLAEVCPFWSASPHRVVLTGHVHHDASKDFPGIRWESTRAFCPPDAYGDQYAPRRAMQAITFHKQRGPVLRATDPIERAATGTEVEIANRYGVTGSTIPYFGAARLGD